MSWRAGLSGAAWGLAIGAALWFTVSAGTGWWLAQQLRDRFPTLAHTLAEAGYELQWRGLERGLWRSRLNVRLIDRTRSPTRELTGTLVFRHGPLLHTLAGWQLGALAVRLVVEPDARVDGVSLKQWLESLRVTGHYDQTFDVRWSRSEVEWAGERDRLTLEEPEMHWRGDAGSGHGRVTLAVEQVHWRPDDGPRLSLTRPRFRVRYPVQDVSQAATLDFERLTGLPVPVRDGRVQVQLDGLMQALRPAPSGASTGDGLWGWLRARDGQLSENWRLQGDARAQVGPGQAALEADMVYRGLGDLSQWSLPEWLTRWEGTVVFNLDESVVQAAPVYWLMREEVDRHMPAGGDQRQLRLEWRGGRWLWPRR